MIIDQFEKSNEIKEKNTPSGKLYITLELIGSLLSFALVLSAFVVFFINKKVGASIFSHSFYAIIILLTLSFVCGISQALRHSYFTIKFYLSLNIITIILAIILMVLEYKTFGVVYIIPFTFIK